MKRVESNKVVYSMSAQNKPVLKIKSGEEVIFETCDCFTNQIQDENVEFNELDWNKVNPATGPVFIEEAKAGDILAVEIKRIDLAKQGVMLTGPKLGSAGEVLGDYAIKVMKISNGRAEFNKKLSIPLNPMIGVIGTAPKGRDILCDTPDYHGGNMDCKEIREGVTLYLPVDVEGGLLALGDLHALMGDGEIGGSGLEVAGEVHVKIEVIKGKRIPLPLIESEEKFMLINSAITLDEAVIDVSEKSALFISERTELSKEEAVQLLSATGDLKICQVVDPLKTVRMEISKKYLKKLEFKL